MRRIKVIVITLGILLVAGYVVFRYINKSDFNPNPKYTLGQPLDSFNGVIVYYNGMVGHCDGRNTAPDGYNIGMRHQCVEFVKRYYYQRFNHRMPDSYGNAKDFFDASLPDSSINPKRALTQFCNGSRYKPRPEDLLIFDGHSGNPYGHVAIIASVTDSNITLIQQNPGPFASSRDTIGLFCRHNKWTIDRKRALGWLRKDTLFTN